MRILLGLGQAYETDKVAHGYLPHYDCRFSAITQMPVRLLEIGVMDGASLRMWRDYFPRAEVFGIDVKEESIFTEDRIRCFLGRQEDSQFLRSVVEETGPLTIVIDDGSHRGAHHVASFETLWPHVIPGGWYCIEDAVTMFNRCWTQPEDRTLLDVLQEDWGKILRCRSDVAEATIMGCGTRREKQGRNNGLIFLHKAIDAEEGPGEENETGWYFD